MTLSIGTEIKNLRAKRNITQEQLATFLGITAQAVSRWENGTAYPDIEMIPSIAGFFGVSTDDLFGINKDEKEKRREEIYLEIEKMKETENSCKDELGMARQFAAEFPSDDRIELNLANTICRMYMWNETPDIERLSEAEKLYRTLIDTTSDSFMRYKALQNLASLYAVGYEDDEKADCVIREFPPMHFSSECIGSWISEVSNRNIGRTQDYIEKLTHNLCYALTNYIIRMPNGAETWDGKVEMFEQLISIYKLVFGENLLLYHSSVAYIYRVIATYRVAQGRYDETIQALEKMVYHVKGRENAKSGGRYTSPIMDTMIYQENDPLNIEYHAPILHNEAWYILHEKLTQSRYDPIRDMEGFHAVVEELTRIAK